MSNVYELTAEQRSDLGKGASRRLRRLEDRVPAVIYGGGEEPASLSFAHNKILKALENEAFYSHIITLDIAGKKQKVVLKAVQRHPSKPKVMHLDFLRITGKEKITMQVPLHFINEDIAPGVKIGKGIVSHTISEVEVRCLPSNLPEFIEVDLASLDLDQTIHLSDLKLPKDVELVALSPGHDQNLSIASIHIPRASLEEQAEDAAANAEATTPEADKPEQS